MTQHIKSHCPHCRHELRVRTEYVGLRVRCRYCKSAFRVSGELGEGSASGEFTVAASGEFLARVEENGQPHDFEISGYETLSLIRKGSMGRVYKARQTRVERFVAVKILLDELLASIEYLQRFHREGVLAGRLAHANIAHILDAGEVSGRPYLVMEYAEGETAQDRLDAAGPFSEQRALEITLALADALAHVHQRGLIHRDVKPANVILTLDGGVKLIDFGLARPLNDEDWAAAEAGNAIGTPAYISPEQVRGQSDLDARSDIYSLGATLYHLVTGHPPYSGSSGQLLRQHGDPRARPTAPDRLNPKLSAGLVGVIATMTSKNREGRYSRFSDLSTDLRRLMTGDRPLFSGVDNDTLKTVAERRAESPRRA